MSLNKVTYASTLTEFINMPSLSLASIHSICVVSSFLHFLSQMSLTSYDQILKGLLSQNHVAKLYMEKIVAVCMKILIWTCCIWNTMERARRVCWWVSGPTACRCRPPAHQGFPWHYWPVPFICNGGPWAGAKQQGRREVFLPSNSTTEKKVSLKCPVCIWTLNVFCNN